MGGLFQQERQITMLSKFNSLIVLFNQYVLFISDQKNMFCLLFLFLHMQTQIM